MKLYELNDQIERILATEVDPDTGEITEATEAALDALNMALEEKLLHCALYLRGELAEADAVGAEADKLSRRAQIHRNRAERLRRYMERHAPAAPWAIREPRVSIAWSESQRVEVVEEKQVPEQYIRLKTLREVDKAKARKALLAGEEIPGLGLLRVRKLGVKV